MNLSSVAQSLVGLLLYFLPGYVAAAVKDALRVPQQKSDLERIATSVILSLAVYLPLWQSGWFRRAVGRCYRDCTGGFALNANTLEVMTAILVVAVAIGVIATLISRWRRLWVEIYRLVGGRSPHRRVWDEAFDVYRERPVVMSR